MRYRSLWLAASVLLGCLTFGSGAEPDLPLPTEWSTHFVWFLIANPGYTPGTAAEEAALTAAHIQYQLRLQADGRAIAAGGLGPGSEDAIVGLTILRVETLAEARVVAGADPAVEAGRLVASVREWWVPSGRLPCGGSEVRPD